MLDFEGVGANWGIDGQGADDADALALAARDLVQNRLACSGLSPTWSRSYRTRSAAEPLPSLRLRAAPSATEGL